MPRSDPPLTTQEAARTHWIKLESVTTDGKGLCYCGFMKAGVRKTVRGKRVKASAHASALPKKAETGTAGPVTKVQDRVITGPSQDMKDMRTLADSITKRYANVIVSLSKL